MDVKNKISRRKFLSLSLVGIGGISLLSLGALNKKPISKWRFFTENEVLILDALVEQIIPTDESMGARDAGATNFIDKQLMGPYQQFQKDYRDGLKLLQQSSMEKFNSKFEELNWENQTILLKLIDKDELKHSHWEKGADKKFFSMVIRHTMQSFYGSPKHGGNKNNVSYKMLKLDTPIIIGQNRYK